MIASAGPHREGNSPTLRRLFIPAAKAVKATSRDSESLKVAFTGIGDGRRPQ
jgi:hypothetical protein